MTLISLWWRKAEMSSKFLQLQHFHQRRRFLLYKDDEFFNHGKLAFISKKTAVMPCPSTLNNSDCMLSTIESSSLPHTCDRILSQIILFHCYSQQQSASARTQKLCLHFFLKKISFRVCKWYRHKEYWDSCTLDFPQPCIWAPEHYQHPEPIHWCKAITKYLCLLYNFTYNTNTVMDSIFMSTLMVSFRQIINLFTRFFESV